MSAGEEEAARFASRHGLEALRAQDPALFATAMARAAAAGAGLPRPGSKESLPAPVFRPGGED